MTYVVFKALQNLMFTQYEVLNNMLTYFQIFVATFTWLTLISVYLVNNVYIYNHSCTFIFSNVTFSVVLIHYHILTYVYSVRMVVKK